jgi:hypothetical protein
MLQTPIQISLYVTTEAHKPTSLQRSEITNKAVATKTEIVEIVQLYSRIKYAHSSRKPHVSLPGG